MRRYAAVHLGEVAAFIRGINFKPEDVVALSTPGAVACMRTKNVQVQLDCSDVWAVGREFVRRDEQFLQAGDVLVSSANSWNLVGKCCWVPELPWPASFGGFVSVLRATSDRVEPRYLYWWFASDRTQALLRSFGRKTTNISNLNLSRCLTLELPLPPVTEQRRIAEVLDRGEELRTKREAALAKLDELTSSLFYESFGDTVRNSKGWSNAATLGDVADIASGITKGRKLSGEKTRAVPYLAVSNVQDRALKLDVVKQIEATEDEINRYRLRRSDLLLTEGGDPDKLGRGTLWDEQLPECIHQNHIFRVRVTSPEIEPLFLSWLIGSERGKRYFLRSAKQTTGIASINMTQLRGFPLLIPPIEVQQKFVCQIAKIECARALQRASLDGIYGLSASLQTRAFGGEL